MKYKLTLAYIHKIEYICTNKLPVLAFFNDKLDMIKILTPWYTFSILIVLMESHISVNFKDQHIKFLNSFTTMFTPSCQVGKVEQKTPSLKHSKQKS